MNTLRGKCRLAGGLFVLVLAALAPACGSTDSGGAGGGASLQLEQGVELCRDGQDNDGDGLADCMDPGCSGQTFCAPASGGRSGAELTTADCQDGRDNDGDGRVDCEDPDCRALVVCNPSPPPSACDCNDNL